MCLVLLAVLEVCKILSKLELNLPCSLKSLFKLYNNTRTPKYLGRVLVKVCRELKTGEDFARNLYAFVNNCLSFLVKCSPTVSRSFLNFFKICILTCLCICAINNLCFDIE